MCVLWANNNNPVLSTGLHADTSLLFMRQHARCGYTVGALLLSLADFTEPEYYACRQDTLEVLLSAIAPVQSVRPRPYSLQLVDGWSLERCIVSWQCLDRYSTRSATALTL